MNQELAELKERMARLSDDELLTIVTVEADQYRPEALDFAKAELKARDIDFEAHAVARPRNDDLPYEGEENVLLPGQRAVNCVVCGGQMRPGVLVAEKELSIIFTDNREERFVRVNACKECGQVTLTVDYETDVG